jgi:IMP cyclohydrolase
MIRGVDLANALTSNRYPGRGVLVAMSRTGLCCGYFLTGRSAASKERTLHEHGGRLIVAPATATGHDPLRHYVAARSDGGRLVYGNGEQVSVIADRLAEGQSPADALNRISYEPDPPIFTPRISVVVTADGIWFGAARRSERDRDAANVLVLAVSELGVGDAVLITTYRSDGVTIATGDPFTEASADVDGPDELLDLVWDGLDPVYRVAAATFRPDALAAASLRS